MLTMVLGGFYDHANDGTARAMQVDHLMKKVPTKKGKDRTKGGRKRERSCVKCELSITTGAIPQAGWIQFIFLTRNCCS